MRGRRESRGDTSRGAKRPGVRRLCTLKAQRSRRRLSDVEEPEAPTPASYAHGAALVSPRLTTPFLCSSWPRPRSDLEASSAHLYASWRAMKGVYTRERTSSRNTSLSNSHLRASPIGFRSCSVPPHPSALGFSGPVNLSLRDAQERSRSLSSSSVKQFSCLSLLPPPSRPGVLFELETPPFQSQRPPKSTPNKELYRIT